MIVLYQECQLYCRSVLHYLYHQCSVCHPLESRSSKAGSHQGFQSVLEDKTLSTNLLCVLDGKLLLTDCACMQAYLQPRSPEHVRLDPIRKDATNYAICVDALVSKYS